MTIKTVHDIILTLLKKDRNEFVSHEDIDQTLDLNQMALFTELLGNYREYPNPRLSQGVTGRTLDDLAPFKKRIQFIGTAYNATTAPYGTGSDGILVLPSDYIYLDAIFTLIHENGITRYRPVQIVSEEEWAHAVDSAVIAPTAYNAIAVVDGSGGTVNGTDIGTKKKLRLNPSGVSGHLWYMKRPVVPVYAYSLSGRVETHDSANSTDLEWNDASVYTIIRKTLSDLGFVTEDQTVIQAAQKEMVSA